MVRLPRNLSRVAVACSLALSLGRVLPAWCRTGPACCAAAPAAPLEATPAPRRAGRRRAGARPRTARQPPPAAPCRGEPGPRRAPSRIIGTTARSPATTSRPPRARRSSRRRPTPSAVLARVRQSSSIDRGQRPHGQPRPVAAPLAGRRADVRASTNKIAGVAQRRPRHVPRRPRVHRGADRAPLEGRTRGYPNAITQLQQQRRAGRADDGRLPPRPGEARVPRRRSAAAWRDLGQKALNPLVAADRDDRREQGRAARRRRHGAGRHRLRRRRPVPRRRSPTTRSAAGAAPRRGRQALARMGAGDAGDINASNSFYDLAEKFYYEQRLDHVRRARRRPTPANVWFWNERARPRSAARSRRRSSTRSWRCVPPSTR